MVNYSSSGGQGWTQELAQQYGQQSGLLKPGETATGGLLIQRARDAGVMDDLQATMDAYSSPQGTRPASFIPATVDPLHQYEKTGLQTMGASGGAGADSMASANEYIQNLMRNTVRINPMATQYLQEGGDLVRQSAAPVTMEEIEEFRNPYAQALKDRLTEEGAQARQQIMAQQGLRGGRSFGDISQGRRESYLDAELGRRRGDIDFKTYESSRDYLTKLRDMQRRSGAQLGSLGTAAQNVTQSGANIGLGLGQSAFKAGQQFSDQAYDTARRQVDAGRYIRDYNQRINDAIAANILGEANYEPQQISTIQNLLAPFQSGMQNMQYSQPSGLAKAGGALMFAGDTIGYGADQGWFD